MIEKLGLHFLHALPPEMAHDLSLWALKMGLVPLPKSAHSPALQVQIAGVNFKSCVGLAAGYDKNAVAIKALSKAGFGFIEVGAISPLPQPGNPKPRLFRLRQDKAIINRFGFNNHGMIRAARRLRDHVSTIPVGLNIGANKTSPDRTHDYEKVLAHCGPFIDFATLNISSPNTQSLRDLQQKEALSHLLDRVMRVRDRHEKHIPIFLKIAPDLSMQELEDIAQIAAQGHVDAIIATNTTTERRNLTSAHQTQTGGLSGPPLFEKSTRILAQLSAMTDLPLIGVGGIASAQDAYEKIRAGASAVQLYSGLVYHGLRLIPDIHTRLETLLKQDGFSSISQAVGTGRGNWL